MTEQLDAIIKDGKEICPKCETELNKCPIHHIGPQCPCKFNWSTGKFSKIENDKKLRYCYIT